MNLLRLKSWLTVTAVLGAISGCTEPPAKLQTPPAAPAVTESATTEKPPQQQTTTSPEREEPAAATKSSAENVSLAAAPPAVVKDKPAEPLEIGLAGPAKAPQRLEDRDLKDLFDELLAAADEGQTSVVLVQHLGARGMTAGKIAAELAAANVEQPARLTALCDVLAIAGRMRRHHVELLKIYDPAAAEMFYGPDSAAQQATLGKVLPADKWPRELSTALVTAAPLVALKWLESQAGSEEPEVDKVRRLCRQWGQWSRQGNERQYKSQLARVLIALLANKHVAADTAAYVDALRAAGDCQAHAAIEAIVKALDRDEPSIRQQAATALGRLGGNEALQALVARSAIDGDAPVLANIAAALGNWPDESRAGAALVALFHRTSDASVRREVLFSASPAHWPQRTELLKAAFDSPEQGILGVALQALSSGVPNELRDKTLALAAEIGEGNPALIDAFGAMADPRGVPYLIKCLQTERNTPLRLKAALALEKIGTPPAAAVLVEALQQATDPLLVEHLVGIAGNLQTEWSEPTLIALAEDATAPMAIRLQAIWALGASTSSRARQSIQRLWRDPRQQFGNPNDPTLSATDAERIELASLFLALARWRRGYLTAETDIQRQFDEGAATTQLSALMLLARLKRDHAVIASGLRSTELPILLAAVRAAGAADPKKYHAVLVELRDSPWLVRLFDSSIDSMNLRRDLDKAIVAGQETSP